MNTSLLRIPAALALALCTGIVAQNTPQPTPAKPESQPPELATPQTPDAPPPKRLNRITSPPSEPSAPDLQSQLNRIERELKALEQAAQETSDQMEQAELREHMVALKREAKRLNKAGYADQAHQVDRKAHDLITRLRSTHRASHPRQTRPQSEPAPEQRLQHLRAAVENLHAAGFHQQADELAQHTAHLQQQLASPKPQPILEDRLQELTAALHSVQSDVADLRRAVRELNARVDALRQP